MSNKVESYWCDNCGQLIEIDDPSCTKCGKESKIVKVCYKCTKIYTVDQKFCAECGTELHDYLQKSKIKHCPYCDHIMDVGDLEYKGKLKWTQDKISFWKEFFNNAPSLAVGPIVYSAPTDRISAFRCYNCKIILINTI